MSLFGPEQQRLPAGDQKRALAEIERRVREHGKRRRLLLLLGGVGTMVCAGLSSVLCDLLIPTWRGRSLLVGLGCGLGAWGLMTLINWLTRHDAQRELRQYLCEHGLPTCLSCGYDLTANVSGRCPECGTPVPGGPAGLPQSKGRE